MTFIVPKTQRFAAAATLLLLPTVLVSGASNADWFPKKDLTTIGVYYYPEAWPESQWARDMARVRKLGMEFVHMGEFAWYFMEPGRAVPFRMARQEHRPCYQERVKGDSLYS